jgi:hypothetical protein
MTPQLSQETISRLQKIAVPLVDTYDTIISRLLDHWEQSKTEQPEQVAPGKPIRTLDDGRTYVFDASLPPKLTFTTFLEGLVDDEPLPKGEVYWNGLMNAVIRRVAAKGHDAQAIYDMLFVNAHVGKKEDNGYKFFADVGISVQGQDSNASYRQAFKLAELHGIKIEARFVWQNNEKAAFPGKGGLLQN